MSQPDNRISSTKSNIQADSTQQSPSRKYNYYTNTISNSAVSTSTIDNHRNSIQQRIANLQAKISQKYNNRIGESRNMKQDRVTSTVSQNYVRVNNLQQRNKKYQPSQNKQSTTISNNNNKPLSTQYVSNNNKRHVDVNNSSLQRISRPQSLSNNYTPVSNLRNRMDQQIGHLKQSLNQNMSNVNKSDNKYNYLLAQNNNMDKGDKTKQVRNLDNRYTDKIIQTRPISRNNKNNQYNQSIQTVPINKNNGSNHYKTLDFNNKTSPKFQPKQYHNNSKHSNQYQYQTQSIVKQHNNNTQVKSYNYHHADVPRSNKRQSQNILSKEKPSDRINNQTHSLPKQSQSFLINYEHTIPQIQQQYTNLSKTISSLRKQPKVYDNFINQQNDYKNIPLSSITPSTTLRENNIQVGGQNVQLYQMMKTILLGQQRLQKQLELIKSKQAQARNSATKKEQNFFNKDLERLPLRQKKYINPKITETSYFKPNINSMNTSPLKNNKQKLSKSPLQQKNTNDKQNSKSQQGSAIKQRRCNSAAQSKNKAGKITKNKQQQFMELYKQAQKSKHLSPINARITISQQAISSVWDRIKSVIERSSVQDIESSKVYHQNNRYINDHLVNTIELQRKLKNDLVKKVYDMCENKCLFK